MMVESIAGGRLPPRLEFHAATLVANLGLDPQERITAADRALELSEDFDVRGAARLSSRIALVREHATRLANV